MGFSAVVRFVAALTTGLVAGIFLGDRMGASFARPALSPSSFVTFQQIQHVHFVKMMPILIGIAILSSAAWLVLIRSRIGSVEFVFLALGALAYTSVIVVTRMVNVPINSQLMTWIASSPPPDAMKIWARWEQVHTVRTFLAVLGFALELLAFGTSKNVPAA
jgi:uncharacterized membrane protein